MDKPCLRLCEWASVSTHGRLTPEQREEIADAARAWQEAHRLPKPPLEFYGPSGEMLRASQYVGVVEAGDVAVEIYPKLDAGLLDTAEIAGDTGTVLADLLWLMEVTRDDQPMETDTAGLVETPATFFDLFALLLARNLRAELMRGMHRRYERREDDLYAVRGRIQIREQVTRHFNRLYKVACVWDEFTPDITLNRVFRCACRWLRERVGGTEARRLLTDCVEMLDEVEDVAPSVALADARNLRHFDRTVERFRLSYDLAVRLLAGTGHTLQTASAETFVFLVDMNELFERYVHAVLEARFGVRVQTQSPVWRLFPTLSPGGIQQKPDFYLTDRAGTVWIGDAKYKHLAKGQANVLSFVAAAMAAESDEVSTVAGRLLSPDDVRQLTVYAELDRRKRKVETPARLMLLYPFVGRGVFRVGEAVAWNDSRFALVPVRLKPADRLSENLPTDGL